MHYQCLRKVKIIGATYRTELWCIGRDRQGVRYVLCLLHCYHFGERMMVYVEGVMLRAHYTVRCLVIAVLEIMNLI